MTVGKEWRYGGSRNSPPRSLSRVQGAYSKERAMTNNSNYFRSAAVVAATLSLMVPITTTPARAEGPSGCHAVDLEAHFTVSFHTSPAPSAELFREASMWFSAGLLPLVTLPTFLARRPGSSPVATFRTWLVAPSPACSSASRSLLRAKVPRL